jgi:hypothetical protein
MNATTLSAIPSTTAQTPAVQRPTVAKAQALLLPAWFGTSTQSVLPIRSPHCP